MGKEDNGLTLDKKTMEVLVANIIPTSKYFEARFDHMQQQIDGVKTEIGDVKSEIRHLEERMDKRFEQVDKRFEQVDKRFEQVDKRFEQIEIRLDKVIERIDTRMDSGLKENRLLSLRLFTFAMTFAILSFAGMFAKLFGLF